MKKVLTTCQEKCVLICGKDYIICYYIVFWRTINATDCKERYSKSGKQALNFYRTRMSITSDTYYVDVEALAGLLGFYIQNVSLGEDAEIMGFTSFDPTVLDLGDQCGYLVTVAVDANTIVLNESIKDSCFGRYRFTLAHEVAHLILDMVYHLNYKVRYRSNPRVIKNMNNNTFDYEEYIANRLASYLLIPDHALRIEFREYFDRSRVHIISPFDNTGDYSKFCKLADYFGVSHEALSIRLQQTGMLRKYYSYQHQHKLDIFPVA